MNTAKYLVKLGFINKDDNKTYTAGSQVTLTPERAAELGKLGVLGAEVKAPPPPPPAPPAIETATAAPPAETATAPPAETATAPAATPKGKGGK